jgi:3',5'-cyclic AMP phosphodiesterase CpdA
MPPVKLAVASDLHLPLTPVGRIAAMAGEVAAFGPDALVVAGDVGESLDEIEQCLGLLKGAVACPVWVLPGNHDLWVRWSGDSQRLFEERLPEVVGRAGCRWLEGGAFVERGVGVAGTIAWYDYSAADPGVKASARDFALNKQYYNNDARMIAWRWTDPEFAARVAGPFLAALDRLEADAAVRQTVVVTHVPLLECQMCRDSGNPDWAFSNAYFGNMTLGAEVLRRRKVTHVVSGHTHVARQGRARAEDGREVAACVIDSDYGAPGWVGLTLDAPRAR